jgi:hypothetical protein
MYNFRLSYANGIVCPFSVSTSRHILPHLVQRTSALMTTGRLLDIMSFKPLVTCRVRPGQKPYVKLTDCFVEMLENPR